MNLDQTMTSSLARFSETIGRQIPGDQLYPLFWPGARYVGAEMHVLSAPVNLVLAPSTVSPKTWAEFLPSAFLKDEHRQAFLDVAGFSSEGGKRYFPLRDTITIGGNDVGKYSNLIFLGTETQLRIPGLHREDDRFLALVRDSDSHHGKGGLFAPGMTLMRSPAICAVSPLNEKTAIVIRNGENFLLLFFRDADGVTGITAGQKMQQVPLLVERIKQTYGDAAKGIAANKIKLLYVELQPDPEMKASETQVKIGYTSNREYHEEESRHVVQYVPGVQALSLITSACLPDNLTGIKPQNLVEGQNLFLADVFSPHFNRPTMLVSPAELKYAASFADNAAQGWSRYGAMMPGFNWRATQYPEVPAARSIPVWKDGKMIQTVYSKGSDDGFVLSPAGGRPGPSPGSQPAP